MKEKIFQTLMGLLRFLGLVLLCGTVATAAVFMLKYKPAEPALIEVYQIKVDGLQGKRVTDIYQDIRPEGPIRPYDLMCAAHKLKGQNYSFDDVLFPAWFHAPGGMVSNDAECSLDGNSLRKKYSAYKEIGS